MTKNVVVVGKPGVGKTSLIHALTGLSRELAPTVGPEVFAIQRDSEVVHLWDTPGQDRYASISARLLEGADLVLSCSADGQFVSVPAGVQALKVRTKDDLNNPWFPADLATSSVSGSGVRALFDAVFAVLAVPAVGSSCCCAPWSIRATHTQVEQFRLDLLVNPRD